ncbi:hypothetical protein Pfo_013933 [Paulownia fortunei]|nr:hypothetical protein Pfo_013933 [Paulownia fortunei]
MALRMDHLCEGGSITRPPLLEGTNYSYWKAKMQAFIKSVDEQAWRAVVTEEVLKPKDQWNTEDEKIANYNSKALNAIFSAVDVNQFKLIAICESAKEVWEILQTAYEGTIAVRMSKLQILASRFENLRMEKSETIATFNAKLCDIANEAQALGEKYSDCKLVRKALRSLPERFAYKVTAIEEARDIEKMKLDELMGYLQIFELNLNHNRRDKGKSMMDENSNKPKFDKSFNSQKDKTNFNSFDDKKNRRIQCCECEGFGHIQAECANTLKQMGKYLTTTWSDEESEKSQENDHTAFSSKMMNNHREHIATNQRYVPAVQYNAMCLTSSTAIGEKNLEICKINKSLEEQIIVLNKEKKSLKVYYEIDRCVLIVRYINVRLLYVVTTSGITILLIKSLVRSLKVCELGTSQR